MLNEKYKYIKLLDTKAIKLSHGKAKREHRSLHNALVATIFEHLGGEPETIKSLTIKHD